MGICGSRPAAAAGDAPQPARHEAEQAGEAERAGARQRLRSQADDDEAMAQAIALSLVMAGGGAPGGDPPADAAAVRPTTAGGREQINVGMLLHVFWDPAWDASESTVRSGGTAYWSGVVISVLGPSEWISAHQDPEEDSRSERQVRARILRNHPALLSPAAWEARSYEGLDAALGGMTLGVPDDARMGPGVAGMPVAQPAGALTRRSSRAALSIDTRAGDLKAMIVAHVRQCGSVTGAAKQTIGKHTNSLHPATSTLRISDSLLAAPTVVERDEPVQSLLSSSLMSVSFTHN